MSGILRDGSMPYGGTAPVQAASSKGGDWMAEGRFVPDGHQETPEAAVPSVRGVRPALQYGKNCVHHRGRTTGGSRLRPGACGTTCEGGGSSGGGATGLRLDSSNSVHHRGRTADGPHLLHHPPALFSIARCASS